MNGKLSAFITLILLALLIGSGSVTAQLGTISQSRSEQSAATLGTAFTYQGYLTDGDNPADGDYDFQFELYDDSVSGTQQGGTVSMGDVTVTDGLFTVQLDFGDGVFVGEALWLEVGVRPADSLDPFTILTQRQALTPAPYALALPGLWTQPNTTSPNLIGGYSGNSVGTGVVGATIGGGGQSGSANQALANYATVSGGDANTASGSNATVGGGWINTASNWTATVGGGNRNTADGNVSTVGGGELNTAGAGLTTVGGGRGNVITATYGTIGGGLWNVVTGTYGTVGGGAGNTIGFGYATIGGGQDNRADGWHSTIGGGGGNTISGEWHSTIGGGSGNTASGSFATIPGGRFNAASGWYSFAAGRRAVANNEGCFVWADSTDADVACNNNNRWVARASGGFYLYTSSDLSTGLYLAAGSETWQSISASDRDLKENFQPVDSHEVLSRLAQVPITTWSYRAADSGARHMSPTAQDFYAAFGLGEDDRHLSSLDTNGVALAAIQGLYSQNQELAAENAAQQEQIDHLQQRNTDLEARLAALEAAVAGSGAPSPSGRSLLPWTGFVLFGAAVLLSLPNGVPWASRRSRRLGALIGGRR